MTFRETAVPVEGTEHVPATGKLRAVPQVNGAPAVGRLVSLVLKTQHGVTV